MSGQPLEEAKRCAEFILDGLQATDQLSLVVYDSDVETLVPAMPLANKETLRRAIRGVASRGMTNLHGGWLQGADLARAGVSTSTYGLGNSFNEDLMIGMARHGHGSSYFGQTAADLMDPFREEFELLNALCTRRVRLEVTPVAGVKAKMLNDYVADDDNAWSLPDLAYGGEAWAVIRLRVPSGLLAREGAEAMLQLCSVTVGFRTIDGEQHSLQPQSLALPAFPASAFNAIAEDELVARRADELAAAQLQVQARTAAQRRDWRAVEVALKKAERIAASNPWVAESLKELRELAASKDDVMFAKESAFAARKMGSRLAQCNEPVSVVDMSAGPSYLRRKASQAALPLHPPPQPLGGVRKLLPRQHPDPPGVNGLELDRHHGGPLGLRIDDPGHQEMLFLAARRHRRPLAHQQFLGTQGGCTWSRHVRHQYLELGRLSYARQPLRDAISRLRSLQVPLRLRRATPPPVSVPCTHTCIQPSEPTVSDLHPPSTNTTDDLPEWLRGDPIAEHLRSLGRPVTKAAWLEAAYGTSNEIVLDYDKETREWIRRHFPSDPHEPVS
jgi:Ca-activated chloride channel homolog